MSQPQQSPSIFNIFLSSGSRSQTTPPPTNNITPVIPTRGKTTTIQTKIPDKSESVVKTSKINIKENERLVKDYEQRIQVLNNEIIQCQRSGKKQMALQKVAKVRKLTKQKMEIEQLMDKDEDNLFKVERTKIISNTHKANKELTEYQRDMMKSMDVLDVKEIQIDAAQMNGEMDYIFDAITGNDLIDEDEQQEDNQAYLDELMQGQEEMEAEAGGGNARNDNSGYIEKQPISRNNRINNMMRF
jgi:hypothetical protein